MFDFDYDYILEDFLSAQDGTSSDNSYLLRKMLLRGITEATFRHNSSEGDKAFDYRRLSWELEICLDDLDSIFTDDGKIQADHRLNVMKAIKLCQSLLAVDQAETNADYNNLATYLTDDLCEDCRDELLAA